MDLVTTTDRPMMTATIAHELGLTIYQARTALNKWRTDPDGCKGYQLISAMRNKSGNHPLYHTARRMAR